MLRIAAEETYSSLEICGPAFIQPEGFPGPSRDEISTPAMGEFVSYDVDVFSVLNKV
jgi:hypothetical protein